MFLREFGVPAGSTAVGVGGVLLGAGSTTPGTGNATTRFGARGCPRCRAVALFRASMEAASII
jgi:hypothetical protein